MVKALPYDYSASIEASLSFGFPTHLSPSRLVQQLAGLKLHRPAFRLRLATNK
jgi:hypothetical protein